MKLTFFIALLFITTNGDAQITKIADLKDLSEISGMIKIHNQFWGLNDGGNSAKLYQFDTTSGNILDSTTFVNASNIDWEELSTNGTEIFIGDFGNNNGTRKDLKIYRFPSSELGKQKVVVDTITFRYASQTSYQSEIFSNYDAEAMLASNDSIFILSKSKADATCRLYKLPNKSGDYKVFASDSLDLNFWVCGATFTSTGIALVGYSIDFSLNLFPWIAETGKALHNIKYQKSIPLLASTQLESVLFLNSNSFLLATETSNGKPGSLYHCAPTNSVVKKKDVTFSLFPNPVNEGLNIHWKEQQCGEMIIYDFQMKREKIIALQPGTNYVNIQDLPCGMYACRLQNEVGIGWEYLEVVR